MNAMPRIYVVDDDEAVRESLNVLLEAEHDVMCFAAARPFLNVAAALLPGCLILDVRMPELGGLELQRRLTERNLYFPIVMMTGEGEVHIAVEAMKAGAVDFIEKPFTREGILESIGLAQDRLAPPHARDEQTAIDKTRLALLSPRELEVLGGLVAGLPNKTIAYDLGLSARTVESHRAHIMSKMHARSFSALVWLALAAGIRERI
jgi:two-component system response regulator FixJ